MDVGNATIIAAAIAAAVSLGSSVFAWCAANKSNKAAAQSNEVTNRTNREIAVFEQRIEMPCASTSGLTLPLIFIIHFTAE